jgi:hypothetical protein
VFSSLFLASVLGARQAWSIGSLPWTSDNYDGLWHNADFTISLTWDPSVIETFYSINGGPNMTVGRNGQPLITREGSNNYLRYWSVALDVNSTPVAEPPITRNGIKLDKTSPTGSITISGGSRYTTFTNVTLSLQASDALSGVSQVRYSNDAGFGGAAWEAYSNSRPWILSSGEGTKTVYYEIMDNAKNTKTYEANIVLDATPPTGSLVIGSNNPTYASSASVTLYLSYSDAVSSISDVRLRNSDNPGWEQWEAASPTRQWTLSKGDGNKTVFYQVRNSAGIVSAIYSDSIVLDTTPPTGVIIINGGAKYAESSQV